MSLRATSAVWEHAKIKRSTAAFTLLLALADCHNDQTGRCHPSYTYLNKRTGFHKQNISRLNKRLVQVGDITIASGTGSGRGNAYFYTITALKGNQKVINKGNQFEQKRLSTGDTQQEEQRESAPKGEPPLQIDKTKIMSFKMDRDTSWRSLVRDGAVGQWFYRSSNADDIGLVFVPPGFDPPVSSTPHKYREIVFKIKDKSMVMEDVLS